MENILNKCVKQLIIITFLGLILFYGVPFIVKLIPPTSGMVFFIILLFIINPIYTLVSSFFLVKNNGLKWYLPILIGVLFAPTILIFYNDSASIYIIAYIIISIIGSLIGWYTKKTKKSFL